MVAEVGGKCDYKGIAQGLLGVMEPFCIPIVGVVT